MSESKSDPRAPGWLGVIVVVLIFLCLTLEAAGGWRWLRSWLESPNAPAWVQAVGAIVAIGGTAWATLHQVRQQQALVLREAVRTTRDRLRALLKAQWTLTDTAAAFFETIGETCSAAARAGIPAGQRRRLLVGLVQLEGRMAQLPIHELPVACVTAALVVNSIVSDMREMFESATEPENSVIPKIPTSFGEAFKSQAVLLKEQCARFEAELVRLADERG